MREITEILAMPYQTVQWYYYSSKAQPGNNRYSKMVFIIKGFVANAQQVRRMFAFPEWDR